MATLNERGAAVAPASSPVIPAAPVKNVANPQPSRPLSKIFITAEMLSQRLSVNGSSAGALQLAYNEYLTPAAEDLADDKHLTVQKDTKPQIATAVRPQAVTQAVSSPSVSTSASIGMVIDGGDKEVSGVIDALGYDGLTVTDFNQAECWMINLQALCQAVTNGGIAGGVAIFPHAADAMVLANKITGIRAVQGTRVESVAAAVRHFDANILIIEHAFSTYHEMRTMIRMFAAGRKASPANELLLTTIGQLERA